MVSVFFFFNQGKGRPAGRIDRLMSMARLMPWFKKTISLLIIGVNF